MSLQNGSQEWKLEKIVSLPGQYKDYSISAVGAAEGFLFFRGAPEGINNENVDCYSLEVQSQTRTPLLSLPATAIGTIDGSTLSRGRFAICHVYMEK
jgi:hypothetical protein